MSPEKIYFYCEKIASYLISEGLLYSKYNIDDANLLLNKTCLPTALKKHLKDNEETIKIMLLKYEKYNHNYSPKPRNLGQLLKK